MSERFDSAYYARFYGDPKTAVHDEARIDCLGRALSGFAGWFGLTVQRVLEVGAGVGLLRDWFARAHPEIDYVSTEYSPHAAERYGHHLLDIAKGGRLLGKRYDLVICQGVLQYLDANAASAAIDNLARACGGLLYLEAITKRDLETVCDRELTDVDVHARSGAFYRSRLGQHFEQVGAGLWHRRGGSLLFYELERAPERRSSSEA